MKELQPVQPISIDNIKTKIYEFRGQKVMLDFDLALLYQVETKRLKEAVKRNIDRFPEDAMFVLTEDEFLSLRSQIATSNKRGGTRYMPFAFTELGISMLSSVLSSSIARLRNGEREYTNTPFCFNMYIKNRQIGASIWRSLLSIMLLHL